MGHHLRANQIVCLLVLAFEDQPPRFRQGFERFTIVWIVWPTRIQRIFVYLQPFITQQGDANIVTSITVTLANAQGTSDPKSAP